MLLVRAHAPDAALDTVAGHTLMATCPPPSHFLAHPETPYPHQMPPDVGTPDLMKLLDLSSRLPLDSAGGEVTPIMAWAMVLGHQRCAELDEGDVRGLKELLVGKIRCYGFGAVLEEFEVRDALMTVFAGKGNGGHGR
ncbi:hypothetical protein M011DRAFT_395420 [Sporormia fimetaria CBS 119925]|uniref:Uncharacterized protein n=1 Tax=Sporormia fimetaria CBS 119925 TaxID=1340428 RepID=A0A6A6VM10_9PLEO|nr:hypothetical protein M011DRAFT_395420 [Sporormia fimetaria CBS 119925]